MAVYEECYSCTRGELEVYTRSVRVVLGLHWGSTGVAVLLQYCSSSTAAVQQQQYWSDKSLFLSLRPFLSLVHSCVISSSFVLSHSRPLYARAPAQTAVLGDDHLHPERALGY